MAESYLMQARDSVTGAIYAWNRATRDWTATGYPGPNAAVPDSICLFGRGGTGAGAGTVVGPTGATDNALARYDTTTGALLQDSLVTVSDTGSITVPAGQLVGGRDLTADGTKLDRWVSDSAEFTSGLATGNVNASVYTVPASPTGATRFRLDDLTLIVTQVPIGGGALLVRLGTTSGGNDLVVDCLVNASTTLRQVVGGFQIATLAAGMAASNGYRAIFAAGGQVWVQLGLTGAFTTAAKVRVVYEGRLFAS